MSIAWLFTTMIIWHSAAGLPGDKWLRILCHRLALAWTSFTERLGKEETDKETESGNNKEFTARHAEIRQSHVNGGDGFLGEM